MISRRVFLMLPAIILPPAPRPLLVGDSLAWMMRPHVPDFDVFAVGGTNADQWKKKAWLPRAILRYRPPIVLVSLGTNDVGVHSIFAKFSDNVRAITERALDMNAGSVLWLEPPNVRGPRVAEALDRAGVEVCPAPEGVELYSDKIHPTLKGYSMWSEHVRAFIA